MYSSARTLGYCIDRAKRRFGKTNQDLETTLPMALTDRLREICAEFDYWFLRVEPGQANPAFPYTTAPTVFKQDRWLLPGWLATQAGTEAYALQTPLQIVSDDALWAPSEASRLVYVKRFGLSGAMECDLSVKSGNTYFSEGTFTGSSGQAPPQYAWAQTIDGVTYLRLNPIPDQVYLMSVGWQLAVPPWFGNGPSLTNLLMFYYPRVLVTLTLLEYAEYYHEADAFAFYTKQLWGDARGRVRSDIPDYGLIGAMKIDTMQRWGQESEELAQYRSLREATGREGFGHRQPGDSYYSGPTPY